MVVSKLASGLRGLIQGISKKVLIDNSVIKDSIKELQRTLLSADVNVKLVLVLSKSIEAKMGDVPKGVTQKEHLIRSIYDELVKLMGEHYEPKIAPHKILLVGVYGQGKTTTVGKLAKFYSKRGLKTAIICTDTWRPAAYEQLRQLSEQVKVKLYGNPNETNSVKLLRDGLRAFSDYDIIIVDSAGRDSLEAALITEIKSIQNELKAEETFLVMGADMGQTAATQAKAFNSAVSVSSAQNAVGLTGVILTKMDSSAKGGGAVSACSEAKIPIAFVGLGEKMDDFDTFDAKKYVARLLGFPDLGSLVKQVREAVEESEISPEELMKEDFTLKTFYKQLEATRKMGPLNKVVEMMGLSMKIPDDIIQQSEEKLKTFKILMDSMTKKELADPSIIKSTRITRIAKGSGTSEAEVRELLKQYGMMKKLFSKVKKGKGLRGMKNIGDMMKMMGKIKGMK